MKLFIIGNGFDKEHELKTDYWDFRTFLDNMYPEFLNSFEKHYDIYPRMDTEAKRKLLWNQLESNLANIDEDVIIENAVSMELGLESGDVGIEDTLYTYFTDEYKYIELLARYLKQWIRTIRIRNVIPKTNFIKKNNDALYITFNYTAVLETVYGVNEAKIIHIHGSLHQRDNEPILGHGNKDRIDNILLKRQQAEDLFDEKRISICKVIEDYYMRTFKDVNRYMYKLLGLTEKDIDEIIVIGHSIAGVDIPYFKSIEVLTKKKALWKVFYHRKDEKECILNKLISCGIDFTRLDINQSKEFYNL